MLSVSSVIPQPSPNGFVRPVLALFCKIPVKYTFLYYSSASPFLRTRSLPGPVAPMGEDKENIAALWPKWTRPDNEISWCLEEFRKLINGLGQVLLL